MRTELDGPTHRFRSRHGVGLYALPTAIAIALTLAHGCARPPARTAGNPLNILVVSLDTVRRDHLSTYGYDRPTSPRLDALARQSVVFEDAIAQETNTAPSHASMFTGLYPHQHGCELNGQRIADDVETIAEMVSDAGYAAAGFVGGFTLNGRITGIDRGFDRYDDDFKDKRRDGRETTARAIRWLEGRSAETPYFLFVHYYDAHGPYLPTAEALRPFRSAEPGPRLARIPPYQRVTGPDGVPLDSLNDYVDRYDSMIRICDDRLGELLGAVDLENTIVVVIADHGETLDERYRVLDHGGHVTDEQIRIPLVVHVPGVESARIDVAVETVDLVPTLLEWIELEPRTGTTFAGRSLAPLMRGDAVDARPFAFACAEAISVRFDDAGYRLDRDRHVIGIRSDDWKLIVYPGIETDYFELYDLDSDPGETVNVVHEHPDVLASHAEALRSHLARRRSNRTEDAELSREDLERLRSLGYLGN